MVLVLAMDCVFFEVGTEFLNKILVYGFDRLLCSVSGVQLPTCDAGARSRSRDTPRRFFVEEVAVRQVYLQSASIFVYVSFHHSIFIYLVLFSLS
jgi:hypothetical protein